MRSRSPHRAGDKARLEGNRARAEEKGPKAPPPEVLIELPYRPRPLQRLLHRRMKRFNVIVCHRRFGKGALYH
jgi:hypothetical protein